MYHILLIVIPLSSVYLTHWLEIYWNINKVQASSGLSLAVVIAMHFIPINPELSELIPIWFFGGSFIGMSAKNVLNRFELGVSSLFFSLFFEIVSPHFRGFGGGLGISACCGVVVALGIRTCLRMMKQSKIEKK